MLVEELAGWPKSFPSVDLVNQYLVVDEDGKAKEWDETSYYQNFLAKGGYVSNAIYKNRDNRFMLPLPRILPTILRIPSQ